MKHQNTHLTGLALISLTILLFDCCQNESRPTVRANTNSNVKETRLGESKYYLQLPDKFDLSEARGKEGQLGYNIIPKDSSSTMFGFIEIEEGNPIIGESSSTDTTRYERVQSYLLSKEVNWTIHKTETQYYVASSSNNGSLRANASSKNRNEIDSLISIIATLKTR